MCWVSQISPSFLNDTETVQASIVTDDAVTAKLFYKKMNTSDNFNFITLDGFNGEVNFVTQKHFGFLPIEAIKEGINHELYFELTNQSGLVTILKNDNNSNFVVGNDFTIKNSSPNVKNFQIPTGRIFNKSFGLNGKEEKFLIINEDETSSNATIYSFSNDSLEKEVSLENKIPVSIADFNNDGKTDILSLYVKNGFIDSQKSSNSLIFENVYSNKTGNFWPAYAEDIDGDNKTEIISFNGDKIIEIWEVQQNLELVLEATLNIFSGDDNTGIFRDNNILVDDFDNDGKKEIATIDNFGRLLLYQIEGINQYKNDFIVELYYPTELKSDLAKGDFNGDGIVDIACLLEFEENVNLTPLYYSAVLSLNGNEPAYLFQNTFISTESNFVSSFLKQNTSISLGNLNNELNEELVIFAFPNSYIFKYNAQKNEMINFNTNVNLQSIFIDDLDNNGINEVGISSNGVLKFYEFDKNHEFASSSSL